MEGEAKHECGLAAIFLKNPEKSFPTGGAAEALYHMLLHQQNRGQLSAGITTYNSKRPEIISTYKNIGLVNEVFRTSNESKHKEILQANFGTAGIGQVRYATFGGNDKAYAQPFERKEGRKWKWFSFAFNGNIANYSELRKQLEEKNYHFQLRSDTEVVMHNIAYGLRGDTKAELSRVFNRLAEAFDGSYNIIFLNAEGDLVAARDPFGIRPLCFGENEEMIAVASESSALFQMGIENIHPIEPGEMLHINTEGTIERKIFAKSTGTAHCMFEWVYFANIASEIDGKSVYQTRYNLGKELAKTETEKITEDHIVVPVPDTAKAAADAFAFALSVPSKEGLIRNRYVGRTFIEGTNREGKAKAKYLLNKSVLEGKKVFLVDDSIVRGTTTKSIVEYIKKYGKAKEVHLRVSCPAIKFPCFYGIDMSTVTELIAARHSKTKTGFYDISEEECREIAKEIGADSIRYQTLQGLERAIGFMEGRKRLCMGCLTGAYPTPKGNELVQTAIKNAEKGIKARTYE